MKVLIRTAAAGIMLTVLLMGMLMSAFNLAIVRMDGAAGEREFSEKILSTHYSSSASSEPPTTQLGLTLDGSSSISASDFTMIKEGVAASIRNYMPHDGTVELTVVQFGTYNPTGARVEVPPTVITETNYDSIATAIENITQGGDATPMADGLFWTWATMNGSTNFANATKQVINIATDGDPNVMLQATPPDAWGTSLGTADDDVIWVRDKAAAEGLDELNAEGIGVTATSLEWMRDYLVYPQPGTITPPHTPGWVDWVEDAEELAEAIRQKFIILFPHEHELAVNLDAPISLEPFDSTLLNATVYNYGLSNETNVKLQLLINGTIVDSIVIPELLTGSSYTLSYLWTLTVEGICNITAYAPPVLGEDFTANNIVWKYVYVGHFIKAVVLDSWGTDFSDFTSTWDALNAEWYRFGNIPIKIDYASLNKENITYQDIVATGGDVLIISSAYSPAYGYEFNDSEIDAIKRYVYEGHGLIVTGLTLYYLVPNNNKLAPLLGLNENLIYNYSWTHFIDLLEPAHPLFTNIPDPWPIGYPSEPWVCIDKWTSIPSDGNWSSNELVGGTYLALGSLLESAIVVYNRSVHISPLVEYYPTHTDYDLQLLYNAITWFRHSANDVAVTNVVPSVTQAYTTWTIQVNVTVHNNGTAPANFTVTAYYNASTWYAMGTQNVTNLAAGGTKTLTFNWTLAGLPANTIHTLKANSTLLNDLVDANLGNNEFVNGQIKIKKVGDVTGDDVVDLFDLTATSLATVAYYGPCDFNNDGTVDVFDLTTVALATSES